VATNARLEAVSLVEALGDPTRRAIVTMLCDHPSSVTTLADALPISRPAVSQHLKVLKDVGLVTDRAEGTRRIYTVQPDALAAITTYFDGFWKRSLMAFRLAAEATTDARRQPDPYETQEHP
jgi:DNA-binding transcriptional ArsR family regulator